MLLWLLLLSACRLFQSPPPVIVVVSMDTTRADAIGAYDLPWRTDLPAAAQPQPSTPTIDQLAARGTRFAWALAQAPTTLSSHASAFSGVDQHQHLVVRNGYPIAPDVPLLAERLQAAGWDTIASVGSAALARGLGLERGFRVYADHAEGAVRSDYMVLGSSVTNAALAAVDQRTPDAPLFLFVHYYDPHMPWQSASHPLRARFTDPAYDGPVSSKPETIGYLTRQAVSNTLSDADARQARGLYLAEVTYVDNEIGRLLGGLEERGLMKESLVVVMADHGETLQENQHTRPFSHGPDVDLVDIHVPFIWAGSGRFGPRGNAAVPAGVVVDRQVRLVDLAPTILGLAGLPPIGRAEDLRPLFRGERPAVPPAFAEATQPQQVESPPLWNNLKMERSVAVDGHILIRTPYLSAASTLYTLDHAQTPVQDAAMAQRLGSLLDAWDAAAPAHRTVEMSAETLEGLRVLGYVE